MSKEIKYSSLAADIQIVKELTDVIQLIDKLVDRVAALEEDTRLIAVEERVKHLQESVDKLEDK